jgi:polyvinyl alcohol dehydrogenase (cytochrome)
MCRPEVKILTRKALAPTVADRSGAERYDHRQRGVKGRSCIYILASLILCTAGFGQPSGPEAIYKTNCAVCHDATGVGRAPSRAVLQRTSPEIVLDSLEAGIMKQQGAKLTGAERSILAEYLTGKKFGTQTPMAGRCEGTPAKFQMEGPSWNGWGAGAANLRFQPNPGISPSQVSRLKLKWAFGFPNSGSASAQPSIVGNRVFVSNTNRHVYSLDGRTGCYYWDYEATAGVRTAPTVVALPGQEQRHVVFFGDQRARAYAVDAETGKLLWKVVVDDSPYSMITGALKYYQGRLFVSISAGEDGQTLNPKYACCKSRGAVASLDAAGGRLLWKTYTTDEPSLQGKNKAGAEQWDRRVPLSGLLRRSTPSVASSMLAPATTTPRP